MSSELDAAVADVFDSYRVALNVGANDGVRTGDRATLWRVVLIKDPVTSEVLGNVKIDNVKMNVVAVQDRLCVAEVRGPGVQLFAFTGPRRRITSTAANKDDSVVVKVGDPATVYLTAPNPDVVGGDDTADAEGDDA